jgi:superfamily II DNA or RNA helicase
MLKPFKHQQRLIDENPKVRLLAHEGGTGKTICACLWLKLDNRDDDALVICPKKVVKKWKKSLEDWNTKATVVNMDSEFKTLAHKKWSAIIVDEVDHFGSPLFIKGTSARAKHLYGLIKLNIYTDRLLLSATPVRSTPYNFHNILCYLGIYIDWKKWREQFFELRTPFWGKYVTWLVKDNWQKDIQPYIKRYSDIVLLSECVDELPPLIEEEIHIKMPKWIPTQDNDKFSDEHMYEQSKKLEHILEAGRKYRKVLVVAFYREHTEKLYEELSKDKKTFMIRGGVKNQEDIIKQAQDIDDCYFVVQASIGDGFDLDTFSCAVFTSMSYAVRDFVQMKFRMRRIHNLHPVKHYYLLAGRCDRAVFNAIKAGRDFVPSETFDSWEINNNNNK